MIAVLNSPQLSPEISMGTSRATAFVRLALASLVLTATPALAQPPAAPAPGQAVYDRACAACHAGGSNAPTRDVLRQLAPEAILTALTSGKMQVQGSTLSDADRRA